MAEPGTGFLWPLADTEEVYDAVADDEGALRPGVDDLCRALGLDRTGLRRFNEGSLPVYAVGDDLVLKLFPPVHLDELPVEAGVLDAVHGRLPVPTPRVHARGEHHGWGYVLMDRLRGRELSDVWPELNGTDREHLADELGVALAALHAIEPPTIPDWYPADWDAFVAGQRAGCVQRQRDRGLPEEWLDRIEVFLDGVDLGGPRVLLHTEVMREHLMVERDGGIDGGTWRLSGLFDLEPAMVGAAEYEFVAVGCFVAAGDARFLRRTLRAYGYDDEHLDVGLRHRLMAWTLLHLYSNLPAYLRRLPGPEEPTFESLADRWFATQDGI